MGAASSSKTSRVRTPPTSTSFMMHSTLMVASGLEVSTFFSFSAAMRRRCMARGLERMSSLCLASNSLRGWVGGRGCVVGAGG